jgi:RNA recognition motif-containing protein
MMGDAEVTKLYLSNMPPAITEDQVRDLFSDFGDISETEILETVAPDAQKTSAAYVVLSDDVEVDKVNDRFNGYDLMGRRLAISPAAPPKELAPATDEERALAEQIADNLQENDANARRQILDVVRFCGIIFAERLYQEALRVNSEGGLIIPESGLRRTIGGVFFKLSKDRMASRMRWFIFRPPEHKKEKKEKPQGEQKPAQKKDKAAKQEKANKKQPPAPAPAAPPSQPALSPEEAQQKFAELQTALHSAQENLAALKSGPAAKQAGLFSAMKQVVELQKQLDNLLKAHPDLR